MEYRILGDTGLEVSMVGFGGIIVMDMPQGDADRAVASAVDKGVNYFDVAPTYGDAEERLGRALKPYRDRVFLACKTVESTKEGASAELHRSLERFHTDHCDVYQLHGVRDMDDLNTRLGPGGAIETLVEAKEKGLTRFIGLTTHTADVALEAMRRFDFDTILSPINFVSWYDAGNGSEVLRTAAEKGVGRLALKSMALQAWPEGMERKWSKTWYQPIDDPELAALAVRFTLSQDVNLMLPPGHLELFEMAVKVVEDYKPLDSNEEEFLRQVASRYKPLFPCRCEDFGI